MTTAAPGALPRVSVITIFRDAERFLAEAIESVRAQSFGDWELLLIDDGSRDGGTAIARAYAEREPERVRYLDHPQHANCGMSASRNLGIRASRGALIAFLDADDVWSASKLQQQVAILDAYPGVAMVCGAVRYWRSWAGGADELVATGHVYDSPVQPPEASLALYPLGRASAPCPSDLLLRRSAVLRVGGFEEHFSGPRQLYEDQAFLAKLYLDAPVYFARSVWLSYRRHEESCMSTVLAQGQYAEVRSYFLRWFADYLACQPMADRSVVRAVSRARWLADHPRIRGLFGAPTGATLRRAVRRIGRLARRATA